MNLDSARVKRVFGCGADGELLSSCVIVFVYTIYTIFVMPIVCEFDIECFVRSV